MFASSAAAPQGAVPSNLAISLENIGNHDTFLLGPADRFLYCIGTKLLARDMSYANRHTRPNCSVPLSLFLYYSQRLGIKRERRDGNPLWRHWSLGPPAKCCKHCSLSLSSLLLTATWNERGSQGKWVGPGSLGKVSRRSLMTAGKETETLNSLVLDAGKEGPKKDWTVSQCARISSVKEMGPLSSRMARVFIKEEPPVGSANDHLYIHCCSFCPATYLIDKSTGEEAVLSSCLVIPTDFFF